MIIDYNNVNEYLVNRMFSNKSSNLSAQYPVHFTMRFHFI